MHSHIKFVFWMRKQFLYDPFYLIFAELMIEFISVDNVSGE